MQRDAMADLAAAWRAAGTVVVLTGAGVSTASAIPDFRGPDGLWTRDPSATRFADIDAYLTDPDLRARSWAWRAAHPALAAAPNPAHVALAELEAAGHLDLLVTQNVDGLHEAAGSRRVAEVHGSMRQVVCTSCPWDAPMAWAVERITAGEPDPRCPECGAITKAGTVFFGQALPQGPLSDALAAARRARLFVAAGTSLVVHPVAALPQVALDAGARLAILVSEPTPLDDHAAWVLREPVEELLPELAGLVTA